MVIVRIDLTLCVKYESNMSEEKLARGWLGDHQSPPWVRAPLIIKCHNFLHVHYVRLQLKFQAKRELDCSLIHLITRSYLIVQVACSLALLCCIDSGQVLVRRDLQSLMLLQLSGDLGVPMLINVR